MSRFRSVPTSSYRQAESTAARSALPSGYVELETRVFHIANNGRAGSVKQIRDLLRQTSEENRQYFKGSVLLLVAHHSQQSADPPNFLVILVKACMNWLIMPHEYLENLHGYREAVASSAPPAPEPLVGASAMQDETRSVVLTEVMSQYSRTPTEVRSQHSKVPTEVISLVPTEVDSWVSVVSSDLDSESSSDDEDSGSSERTGDMQISQDEEGEEGEDKESDFGGKMQSSSESGMEVEGNEVEIDEGSEDMRVSFHSDDGSFDEILKELRRGEEGDAGSVESDTSESSSDSSDFFEKRVRRQEKGMQKTTTTSRKYAPPTDSSSSSDEMAESPRKIARFDPDAGLSKNKTERQILETDSERTDTGDEGGANLGSDYEEEEPPSPKPIPLPLALETLQTVSAHATFKDLEKNGFVVLQCFTPEEVDEAHVDFYRQMLEWPEFTDNIKDQIREWVNGSNHIGTPEIRELVRGSFGALGNPSSFHHPVVRAWRKKIKERVRGFFARSGQVGLELLLDRMCIRRKGTSLTAESWHRDISEVKSPGEVVFGGWVNLNHSRSGLEQYFKCLPGTHLKGERGPAQGFVVEKGKTQEYNKLFSTAFSNKPGVKINPGEIIIFFQDILHSVPGNEIKEDSVRLFAGFRLVADPTFIGRMQHEYNKMAIKKTAPIMLPSGQLPPMYPKMNLQPLQTDSMAREVYEEKYLSPHQSSVTEKVVDAAGEHEVKKKFNLLFPVDRPKNYESQDSKKLAKQRASNRVMRGLTKEHRKILGENGVPLFQYSDEDLKVVTVEALDN